MARRKSGRKVNGILLLDKAAGITSNKALQQVKHLFRAQKAGHTGSLDPLATGLLPICLGEATKISAFLLDADKRYQVQIKLGEKTSTADAEGEVIETRPLQGIDEAAIAAVLPEFVGEIQQLPPMHSALKHQGERLYKLARQGIEVERTPRDVTIFSLSMTACELPFVSLEVHCSKGTYVRTLAEDIGERLGCGAHVAQLRRTAVGPYRDGMVTFEQLEAMAEQGFAVLDEQLQSLDSAIHDWPDVHLSSSLEFYLKQGQAVLVPKAPTEGLVRLYGANDSFIGVGCIESDGKVAPKRLMSSI
ncbi:MAG: tRNA pseudouridine(55) synthase TruB [Chromatiales bacterium]|jgi:tRNA pseudouridine55 synthase